MRVREGGGCAMAACSCPIISLKLRAVLMPRIATSRTTLTSSSVLDQRRVGSALSFFFFRFGVQAFSTSSGASLSKPRGILRRPSVRSPRRRTEHYKAPRDRHRNTQHDACGRTACAAAATISTTGRRLFGRRDKHWHRARLPLADFIRRVHAVRPLRAITIRAFHRRSTLSTAASRAGAAYSRAARSSGSSTRASACQRSIDGMQSC